MIVVHVGAPMSGVVQTTEGCAGGGDVVDGAVTGAGVDTGEKPVRRRNVGVGGFVGGAGFVGTVAVLTHR